MCKQPRPCASHRQLPSSAATVAVARRDRGFSRASSHYPSPSTQFRSANMKTSRRGILQFGAVLALLIGFGGTSFAGPGPRFWRQQEKLRAGNAAIKIAAAQAHPAAAPSTASAAPKRADSPPQICAKCKTDTYEEFSATKTGNEYVMRTIAVGTKHTCDTCGGRITQAAGQTHNAMMDYCAICAKARRECCTIENRRAPAES